MSLWGSCRMISRSLHVPGSDSSALTTRYDGLPSDTCNTGYCYAVRHLGAGCTLRRSFLRRTSETHSLRCEKGSSHGRRR